MVAFNRVFFFAATLVAFTQAYPAAQNPDLQQGISQGIQNQEKIAKSERSQIQTDNGQLSQLDANQALLRQQLKQSESREANVRKGRQENRQELDTANKRKGMMERLRGLFSSKKNSSKKNSSKKNSSKKNSSKKKSPQ